MPLDRERDDEETHEHHGGVRYPDAAKDEPRPLPPTSKAPRPELEPTAAWPKTGQQWEQQHSAQWPHSSGEQTGSAWQGTPSQAAEQPGRPWQQPAQGWQQPQRREGAPGWAPEQQYVAEYSTSPMVALAGIVLLVYGLLLTLIGGVGVAVRGFPDELLREAQRQGAQGLQGLAPEDFRQAFVVFSAFVLILGVLHLPSAIGIFLHKQWARVIGILLAVLGTLVGVLLLVVASSVGGSQGIFPIAMTLGYGFTLFALIAGSNHFRRRWSR